MHDLTPITALGNATAQSDIHGGVTCQEVPDVALASFTARLGHEKKALGVLEHAIEAPAPPVGKASAGAIAAFWTAPDQWMVEAPIDSHEDLPFQLAQDARGVASVTEQTDAWTRFDLSGDSTLAVLELLCAADTRTMQAKDVTRSAIHHLGCFVRCHAPDHFSIYGPRASAGSLHHAIITAMKSAL